MRRAGLAFLVAYAALGLAISLYVHVLSFFGPPPGGDGLFVALHVGIFPLWFCVIFIANRMTGGTLIGGGRRFAWKPLLDRAPPALRYMTIGFFIYAFFNFALFFLTVASQPHVAHAAAAPGVWRGFSGHWMAFYSAALTVAATAYLHGMEPARCPNGHVVGLDDAFCPRCGLPVSRLKSGRV